MNITSVLFLNIKKIKIIEKERGSERQRIIEIEREIETQRMTNTQEEIKKENKQTNKQTKIQWIVLETKRSMYEPQIQSAEFEFYNSAKILTAWDSEACLAYVLTY